MEEAWQLQKARHMKTPLFNSGRDEDDLLHLLDGLTQVDRFHGRAILGGWRPPDLVIAPNGKPYLYRWHIYLCNKVGANSYLHIQVANNPICPLHDHPWDNMSVILSGGYTEHLCDLGYFHTHKVHRRRVGSVVFRRAEQPHRLLLLEGIPYTMTLFSTGPKIRRWGFWYPDGWVDADKVCRVDGNVSIRVGPAP